MNSEEEKFQIEINTWLWFSTLSGGKREIKRVKSKTISKNCFIIKLLRKKKIMLGKDESGIKNIGMFLFEH